MIEIIYMAGGNSRRFGSNKLLHNIDGSPMFVHALKRLKNIIEKNRDNEKWLQTTGGCSLLAVTQYKQVAEYCRRENIPYVYSESCAGGMSFSVKAGVERLADRYGRDNIKKLNKLKKNETAEIASENAVMFCHADQPYLKESTIEEFIEQFAESRMPIGLFRGRISGEKSTPSVFAFRYLDDLMNVTGDMGGREILRENMDKCYFHTCDDRQLKDVDYPEDLQNTAEQQGKTGE